MAADPTNADQAGVIISGRFLKFLKEFEVAIPQSTRDDSQPESSQPPGFRVRGFLSITVV